MVGVHTGRQLVCRSSVLSCKSRTENGVFSLIKTIWSRRGLATKSESNNNGDGPLNAQHSQSQASVHSKTAQLSSSFDKEAVTDSFRNGNPDIEDERGKFYSPGPNPRHQSQELQTPHKFYSPRTLFFVSETQRYWSLSDQAVREYFSQYGKVRDAWVAKDKETLRTLNYGQVYFENDEDIDVVLQNDGSPHYVNGVPLLVKEGKLKFHKDPIRNFNPNFDGFLHCVKGRTPDDPEFGMPAGKYKRRAKEIK